VEPVSILSIVIGALTIAVRGPLAIAPAATLRVYTRLTTSRSLTRVMALAFAPLAVAIFALPLGRGALADFLRLFGLFFVSGCLWLLISPGTYTLFANAVIDFAEDSTDDAIIRLIGIMATAIGVAMIYWGISAS
jgi:small neutral amino acid transporter SnatA (MarC family)